MKKTFNFFTLILLLAAISAHAHVPFLKPNLFRIDYDRLVIESSFTEFPFQADFAMDTNSFAMINPEGQYVSLKPVAQTKAAVYLEPEINSSGTYRITTGVRKGPLYDAIETPEGKLYFADDMKKYKGAKTKLQYYNSADTYVYKDVTNYTPKPLNVGVEIIPLSSPNEMSVGKSISFQVLNEGKAVKNARVVVVYDDEHYQFHRDGDLYDVENIRESNIYTDDEGNFTFTPDKAGLLMLFVTIHKKFSPEYWESYNTSITLEAQLK